MTTDSITARVGGRDIVFKIHREDLDVFEARHGSAFEMLNRIAHGKWTAKNLADVLRFASSPRPDRKMPIEFAGLIHSALADIRGEERDGIDEAFAANGPGPYAPLAFKILNAALFGVEEDEAAFSDEEAEVVAEG